jgi:general nucleoside transport system ATP-binding protein
MNLQAPLPLLIVENLTKRYGQTTANDHVSFEIQKGQVHCMLGENGAGKSTLAKCIYGASKPDAGKIIFKGNTVDFSSPREAIRMGIGMVHQHFVLAEPMNAVENIIVGEESTSFLLNLHQEKKKIKALCDRYGILFDLDTPVSKLSVGEQQWIEILKALYVGVDLLLLDEPTAVLTPQEVEKLFSIIKKMAESGISVILITHKLHEVMDISDKVTVLRKGKVIATVDTKESTRDSLARLLVGHDFDFVVHKEKIETGGPILTIENLTVLRDNGSIALDNITLTINRGEVLGLAGVSGNGQPELFDAVVGIRQAKKGVICLDQEKVTNLSPNDLMKRGIASIPQDRLKQGLIGEFTVQENFILGYHRSRQYGAGLVLNWKDIKAYSEEAIRHFDIATLGPEQTVNKLSGGNLQKVIIARELSRPVKFLIANSPTRGLDINATYYVYQRFLDLLKSGAGILLISEDLDEIFNISDRIAVIYNGRIMGLFNRNDIDKQKIGMLMAGIQKEEQ